MNRSEYDSFFHRYSAINIAPYQGFYRITFIQGAQSIHEGKGVDYSTFQDFMLFDPRRKFDYIRVHDTETWIIYLEEATSKSPSGNLYTGKTDEAGNIFSEIDIELSH